MAFAQISRPVLTRMVASANNNALSVREKALRHRLKRTAYFKVHNIPSPDTTPVDLSAMSPAARQAFRVAAVMFGITIADILGRRKCQVFVLARKYVCRRLEDRGYSMPQIAKLLQRDHTTVLHHLGRLGRKRGRQ